VRERKISNGHNTHNTHPIIPGINIPTGIFLQITAAKSRQKYELTVFDPFCFSDRNKCVWYIYIYINVDILLFYCCSLIFTKRAIKKS
jgi:hypothetical protein